MHMFPQIHSCSMRSLLVLLFMMSRLVPALQAQSPIVVVSHPAPEIGGHIIDHGDHFSLLGKFDSADAQYLFSYDFSNEGDMMNNVIVPVPSFFTQFSLMDVLVDSVSEHIYYIGHGQTIGSDDWQAACISLNFEFAFLDYFIAGDSLYPEVVYSGLINADGNIILGGWQLETDLAFLFEYQFDGLLVQEKYFNEDTTWLGVIDVVEDIDGQFYYTSQSKYEITVIDPSDLSIVSTTTNAVRDSSYLIKYMMPIATSSDMIISAVQKPSDDVPYENYYLARLTNEFDTVWTIDLGLDTSDIMLFTNSSAQVGSDSFIVAYISCVDCMNYIYEQQSHDIHVIQFSGSGEIRYETVITDTFNLSYLKVMPALDGGAFILAAYYNWNTPENYLDIAVYKLDAHGNVVTSLYQPGFLQTDILVFPNPTTNILQVQINDRIDLNYFELFDIMGNLVFTASIAKGMNSLTLPEISPGTYFYVMRGLNTTPFAGSIIKH